jgi:hypothetical protein
LLNAVTSLSPLSHPHPTHHPLSPEPMIKHCPKSHLTQQILRHICPRVLLKNTIMWGAVSQGCQEIKKQPFYPQETIVRPVQRKCQLSTDKPMIFSFPFGQYTFVPPWLSWLDWSQLQCDFKKTKMYKTLMYKTLRLIGT